MHHETPADTSDGQFPVGGRRRLLLLFAHGLPLVDPGGLLLHRGLYGLHVRQGQWLLRLHHLVEVLGLTQTTLSLAPARLLARNAIHGEDVADRLHPPDGGGGHEASNPTARRGRHPRHLGVVGRGYAGGRLFGRQLQQVVVLGPLVGQLGAQARLLGGRLVGLDGVAGGAVVVRRGAAQGPQAVPLLLEGAVDQVLGHGNGQLGVALLRKMRVALVWR